MGIGMIIVDIVAPVLELISPMIPGDFFPYYFNGKIDMLKRSLIALIMVTIVAGFLGVFLLIQNLALIGDGLAHVSHRCEAEAHIWPEELSSNSAPCVAHARDGEVAQIGAIDGDERIGCAVVDASARYRSRARATQVVEKGRLFHR